MGIRPHRFLSARSCALRPALRRSLVASVVAWPLAAAPADAGWGFLTGPAFDAFARASDARCPDRPWRRITPGDLDALQEPFVASLPPKTRRRLAEVDDAEKRCADRDGLSCPTTQTLAAFERLQLMPSFAAYACAHPPRPMSGGGLRRAVCVGLMTIATFAAAQTRVYSNACFEDESGDVDGYVVTVDRTATSPNVQFQWSEGALMQAVPAEAIFDAKLRRLAFTVHTTGGDFRFDGRLAGNTLAGSLRAPWDTRVQQVVLRLQAAPGSRPGRCMTR